MKLNHIEELEWSISALKKEGLNLYSDKLQEIYDGSSTGLELTCRSGALLSSNPSKELSEFTKKRVDVFCQYVDSLLRG